MDDFNAWPLCSSFGCCGQVTKLCMKVRPTWFQHQPHCMQGHHTPNLYCCNKHEICTKCNATHLFKTLFFSICSAWYGSGLMYICEHFIVSLTEHLFCFFAICIRNDKGSAHAIRRVSSQGGSLNRGLQSWGTRPPPLPREPPPQEEPTPSPQTKTPK